MRKKNFSFIRSERKKFLVVDPLTWNPMRELVL